jgi:hypothetical protein
MIDKSFIDKAVIRIIESSDMLMEFFGRKQSKKEESKKIYDGNKVRSDLNKITNDVRKLLNQPDVKKFVNNGLTMVTGDKRFELTSNDSEEYESHEDEFILIDIDLWDYNGGNPRVIMNDSPDGWHPVDHAVDKLNNDIRGLLSDKYPDFYLTDYGGDWDTGSITIGLK